jgi:hypothetical protein
MVATFSSFDEYLASRASFPIFEVLLEIYVAGSAFVLREFTFFAELNFTFRTLPFSS